MRVGLSTRPPTAEQRITTSTYDRLGRSTSLSAAVINQDILTVVATLNNVVRLTRNDNSGPAGPAYDPRLAGRKVKKQVNVPCCCPSLFAPDRFWTQGVDLRPGVDRMGDLVYRGVGSCRSMIHATRR